MRWLIALTFMPALAMGHAGDLLDSLDIAVPTKNQPGVLLESTIGAIWAANGQDFSWVCHESITRKDSVLTPRYLRSSAGFTLATVPRKGEGRESQETVYRSTDHCNWSSVVGLTDYVVEELSENPTEPNTVYAIANHPDTAIAGGVFRSIDAGLNWDPTSLARTDRIYRSILASGDDIWVSSVRFEDQRAWLNRSSDQGLTWTEWTFDFSAYSSPPDLQLLTATDETTWFKVTQTLEDEFWNLENDTAKRLHSADTKIMSATRTDAGELFLALWNQGIAQWTDNTLTLIPESPKSYAVRSFGNTLYAATRPLFTDYGLMTSEGKDPFEGIFAYSQLGPPPKCDATSHSAQFCDPLWDDLKLRLTPEPEDTGETGETGNPKETGDDIDSSSCQKSGPQGAWLLLVPFLGLRRLHRSQH